MDNRPVLYLDSGIGGIPYCRYFTERNPNETVHYLADRKNFPYGPRKREELIGLLTSLIQKLIDSLNPKIAVVACNTATVSALEALRQNFPGFPFVGTVPAVKPAIKETKTGKVGVIATERTINDPCIRQLASGACEVVGIAAPDLVAFVEQRFAKADEKEKSEIVKKYIRLFSDAGADCIVLGCTHFLFLKDEFVREGAPNIKIIDSVDGVTRRAEFLLDENSGALRAGSKTKEQCKFLITGSQAADASWQGWAGYLGFPLSLFDV